MIRFNVPFTASVLVSVNGAVAMYESLESTLISTDPSSSNETVSLMALISGVSSLASTDWSVAM